MQFNAWSKIKLRVFHFYNINLRCLLSCEVGSDVFYSEQCQSTTYILPSLMCLDYNIYNLFRKHLGSCWKSAKTTKWTSHPTTGSCHPPIDLASGGYPTKKKDRTY